MTLVDEKCPGSGRPPLEQVILDTVPGVDPQGTCPECKLTYTLDFYRLPVHGTGN